MPSVPQDKEQVRRVATFVVQLSDELPALVSGDTIYKSYALYLSAVDQAQVRRLDSGGEAKQLVFFLQHRIPASLLLDRTRSVTSVTAAVAGLDSLRPLWETISVPARRAWLFQENGLYRLTAILLTLAQYQPLQPAVQQFATAAITASRIRMLREDAEALTGVGHALAGALAVTRGDTTRAIVALLATARTPRTFVALPAARLLCVLTETQSDTVLWLKALTLRHLETAARSDSASQQADAKLRTLFGRFVAQQKPLPDLVPDRANGEPLLTPLVSPDHYLDRQWTLLYDREFSVRQADPATIMPSSLIVVEYTTGLACSGCWYEDRGLQALLRRYPGERVLPLAYHNWQPVVSGIDSLWHRFIAWYPQASATKGYQLYREAHHSRGLPSTLLVSATGDSVDPAVWVNGHGLPHDQGAGLWADPPGESHYRRAVMQIDSFLSRRAELAVRLRATVQHDSVRGSITVDSLRASSLSAQHPLALRIILFQDTVWMYGGTIRRIYTNVVRAAVMNDTLSLGIPIRLQQTMTFPYVFDVAALQRDMYIMQDPQQIMTAYHVDRRIAEQFYDEYAKPHPDPRDWRIDRTRLHVVAIVQDLTTGDILGAAQVKVRPE